MQKPSDAPGLAPESSTPRSSLLLVFIVLCGALLLYARTAAPDVLSGDSGEFQFAAPLLGIPHPTGYPLLILLGKLATLLPFGAVAYRVTLVSVLAGAWCVALLALLVHRATGSVLVGMVGAGALAVAPGMWNAATIAEVYTLNALFLVLLLWLCWQAAERTGKQQENRLRLAALVAGLGISHHGSFAFIGAPLFLLALLPVLVHDVRAAHKRPFLVRMLRLASLGMLGLTPWLFVLLQYARMAPFNGLDHGLNPNRHPGDVITYFWGAPISWGEAVDHLVGGVMRNEGAFQYPSPAIVSTACAALWDRLWFEVGGVGLLVGLVGCIALLRTRPRLWVGSMWIAGATIAYFTCLGPAVTDALMFTLPLVLAWAIWVGAGAAAIASAAGWLWEQWACSPGTTDHRRVISPVRMAALLLLLALTAGWGYTRYPYGNKAHLWLFRTFGEGALAHMETGAVVMVRWEQGTVLTYLCLVEGQRPDVWVDMVEPGDEPWPQRAQRRYAGRAVYIVGNDADAMQTGAQRVWGTDYAVLFRLQQNE